jgi:hypothetical protein
MRRRVVGASLADDASGEDWRSAGGNAVRGDLREPGKGVCDSPCRVAGPDRLTDTAGMKSARQGTASVRQRALGAARRFKMQSEFARCRQERRTAARARRLRHANGTGSGDCRFVQQKTERLSGFRVRDRGQIPAGRPPAAARAFEEDLAWPHPHLIGVCPAKAREVFPHGQRTARNADLVEPGLAPLYNMSGACGAIFPSPHTSSQRPDAVAREDARPLFHVVG